MSVLRQTEAEFQAAVIQAAQANGWMVAHFRGVKVDTADGPRHMTPVAADGVGFPDLVLVRDRLVVAELKTDRGQMSGEQAVWLSRLRKAGVEAYLWRPTHWPDIETVLSRRSARST